MSKKNELIKVNNDKALADALKEKYGTIILEGDSATKLRKELDKYRKKQKINGLMNIGILVGLLFPPLLVASLVGTVITQDDLNKYNVDIIDDQIMLKLKNRKKL